ncbi:MAG: site-specific DNA-methyltransferase [Halioglobus sp.]|nr:site-specific DNA-methyltransferase [Halioglobus sp.]
MSNSTQQLKARQRREKFADLLREMFQLNQPELDFGLYRIMHARKDEINRFIEQDLPDITCRAFEQFAGQDKTLLEQALEQARKAAMDAGFEPEESPKVKQLQAQLADGFDLAREEGEVYDALVTFFSRYYSEGDFLSRRVYKGGTYAIPYQGEEVVLHWANKDQYYIKSSETLRDYSFRLNPDASQEEDPMRVHFKLVDAEAGARDNNKEAADSKRVFVLDADRPFTLIEGEPTQGGDTFAELELRFMFRAATADDWTEAEKSKATAAARSKPPSQDALRNIAIARLLGTSGVAGLLSEPWLTALDRNYRKADGEQADYSTLQGQLNNYTKKNTFDYFIHKDLGGFLNRELEFYIKNELLDWADIASLKHDTARLAPVLSKIEVIRALGEMIITFLAQLENFQKKLWLKKKFVTESNYCITLDRIEGYPELLQAAFSNERQKEEWARLYKLDLEQLEADITSISTLTELIKEPKYRFLMLDTVNFDQKFTAALIASIEDLDEQCRGLLIHSENFQALNLITARYRHELQCLYIDPPYNTNASSILYKNGYKDSSWLSLLSDRLIHGAQLLKQDGISCTAIDDVEMPNLQKLLNGIFPKQIGISVVRSNPQSRKTRGKFSPVHEYALFYGNSEKAIPGTLGADESKRDRYPLIDENGRYAWMNFIRAGTNDLRTDRPKSFYPIVVDEMMQIRIPNMEWNESAQEYDLREKISDSEQLVWPIKHTDGEPIEKRWQRGHRRVSTELSEYRVREDKDGKLSIDFKTRMDEGAAPTTWWDKKAYASSNYGTAELQALLGETPFDFPKAVGLVTDCLLASGLSEKGSIVMDFFAGSGTTGQAVIKINKQDSGERKFILCEMGEHFDSVVKPRILRSSYSEDWDFGNLPPEAEISQVGSCIKIIKLESYEDSLGNLSLNQTPGQQELLSASVNSDRGLNQQAYILNYLLEVETRGSQSLLNIQQFLEPNYYQLKVRSVSGDETKAINVDLLETFNYLLGLRVEHIAAPTYFDATLTQGEFGRWQAKVKRSEEGKWWFRTVYGTNPNGQKVLVVWRNLPSVIAEEDNGLLLDNAVLDAVLIQKLRIRLTESPDDEIDLLYVNGDHNINIPRNRKGEPMEQARVQLIEEAFHSLMFADTESVN